MRSGNSMSLLERDDHGANCQHCNNQTTVLITGGTGSFGTAFTRYLTRENLCKRVIIYSRDERKQAEMMERIRSRKVDYFIGDVRDYDRLRWALESGPDLVIHAAAMKRVEASEYNPLETVKTNVDGAANLIRAAQYANVQRVIALSTDKAVNPVNLYGSTKLTSEKLFIRGNLGHRTAFSCVRWGNVFGSRGSVIERVARWRRAGKVGITDPKMTRFWIRLEDVVKFVLVVERLMKGGEIFIPHLPAASISRIANVLVPNSTRIHLGARPGEKIHERLIAEGEERLAKVLGDECPTESRTGGYIIEPDDPQWEYVPHNFRAVDSGFEYRSDTWSLRMTDAEIADWYNEWESARES